MIMDCNVNVVCPYINNYCYQVSKYEFTHVVETNREGVSFSWLSVFIAAIHFIISFHFIIFVQVKDSYIYMFFNLTCFKRLK